MLVYIIDGFNLIHKIASLKRSVSPHRDLIRYIKEKRLTGSKNNRVIIVFDGKINEDLKRVGDFEIVFSGDRSADEVIKEKIEKIRAKSEVIVVSDDREIREAVKIEGARSLPVLDFISRERRKKREADKEISYTLAREITEELRKIWLDNK
jgi:predicted RNA-binding protein with PIN domain